MNLNILYIVLTAYSDVRKQIFEKMEEYEQFPSAVGVMIKIGGKNFTGRHKQKWWGSIFSLENEFSNNTNQINLKLLSIHGGITDLRDSKKKPTNIQEKNRSLRNLWGCEGMLPWV